ncbi:MAG: hypothetical protein A2033_01070 [Bacteroidetes bacterium GWA2_31_9]|nr:MAG: hypothetical protein A2033_01070 [Bacteroidetes bacterium GWA2_31_9]
MIDNNNIPKHWQFKKLGEVISILGDGLHGTPKYSNDGEYYFINGNNLCNGKIIIKDNTKKVSRLEFEKYKKPLNDKTILLSINGTLGNVAFYNNEKVILGKSACYFNLLDCVNKNYIRILLSGQQFLNYAQKIATGSTIKNVSLKSMRELEIPIPPLPEQQQIVSKIEELFSELDKGIENLKTAQQQLKVYRQSLLKWAFEGKLTNVNVKEGELPKGWKWVNIENLLFDSKKGMSTGPFGTMLKKHEHQPNGVPVLGIENIGEGVFQMPNKIFVTKEKAIELKNFRVKENDIIISRSGTVGEICLLPKKMEDSIISTNLIRVRLNQKIINPKFFVYLFQGGKVRQQVFDLCKGSSRAFLNQTILRSLKFPFCTIEEQQLIVSELESRLTVCDKMEETITNSLQQAETLRQSILKRAFEGKLI